MKNAIATTVKIYKHLKSVNRHAPNMPLRLVFLNVVHIAKNG